MTTTRCYFHGPERVPRNLWRVCFECGHPWTRLGVWWANWRWFWRDLRRWGIAGSDDLSLGVSVRSFVPRRPANIHSCPRCVHDW